MGTILASAIINNARIILQDATGVRWLDAELLAWLNDGQRETLIVKPDAYVKQAATQMVPGTKQALPDDGLILLDILRNMGSAGTTPGSAVKIMDAKVLNEQRPGWHTIPASMSALFFCYSEKSPKTFSLYPPQPATAGYVELVYSALPANVATIAGAITLDDIYAGPLMDYILFRAYSKDAEYAGDGRLAGTYYQRFVGVVTGKEQAETVSEPKQKWVRA